MKILFLDAYFEPEQIAFTHLEKDLLDALVKRGHEVEIICPIPTRGVDRAVAESYKERLSEYLYHGRVHVTRFYAPQEGKCLIGRAFRYFWCNFQTYWMGRSFKNIDVVFSNSTPPTQGWIAGKVAKKIGAPFIFSLQDIFPDSLVNAKMAEKDGPAWNVGRQIEDKTYKHATKIITISEAFKENIIRKGVSASKIEVVPNWVDISAVYPITREQNKIVKRYGLNPKMFYACYCGNIGKSQNLKILLQAAKEIQERDNEIQFVIFGEGVEKKELEEEIRTRSIRNVLLLPFQPYEEIAHVFSLGDVGMVLSKAGIGGSSVPSKTWSIMSAGRPVVASFDLDSELARLVDITKSGFVVSPTDVSGFVRRLLALKEERDRVVSMGMRGREYVVLNLNKEKGAGRYIEIMEKCAKSTE